MSESCPKSAHITIFFDVVDDITGCHDTEADMSWALDALDGLSAAITKTLEVNGWPGTNEGDPENARLMLKISDLEDVETELEIVEEVAS